MRASEIKPWAGYTAKDGKEVTVGYNDGSKAAWVLVTNKFGRLVYRSEYHTTLKNARQKALEIIEGGLR